MARLCSGSGHAHEGSTCEGNTNTTALTPVPTLSTTPSPPSPPPTTHLCLLTANTFLSISPRKTTDATWSSSPSSVSTHSPYTRWVARKPWTLPSASAVLTGTVLAIIFSLSLEMNIPTPTTAMPSEQRAVSLPCFASKANRTGAAMVDTNLDEALFPAPILATCLASQYTSLPVMGLGDSHGRDLLLSPLKRLGGLFIDKERHWIQVVPAGDRNTSVRYEYHGTPRNFHVHKPSARPSPSTHVLLSRGTWDLMKYSTPLSRYYAEVRELVRGAAATEAASVTFKAVHRFAAPTAELGFFAECTQEAIVSAYRRVGACAVAAHNRDAVAHNAPSDRRVSVLDAWEATAAWPREAFADDGHHLAGPFLHAVADAYLGSIVCPTNGSSQRTGGIWIESDPDLIEARFNCAELEPHIALSVPEAASGDIEADTLDAFLGVGTRPGCRCNAASNTRVNDHCAFGRMSAAIKSHSKRFGDPQRAVSTFVNHACTLHDQVPLAQLERQPWRTAIPLDRLNRRLSEPTFAMCAHPSFVPRCVHFLAGVTNDSVTEACYPTPSPRDRARLVTLVRQWHVFRRAKAAEFGLAPVGPLNDRMLPTITCEDRDLAVLFFSMACDDAWHRASAQQRVQLIDAHLQALVQRATARHHFDRRHTERHDAVVRTLKAIKIEFSRQV